MSRYGFGNQGHYRGETLAEMHASVQIALERKFRYLSDQLVAIVGVNGYDKFCDENHIENLTWGQAIEEIHHELDLYKCNCTPNNNPCSGCKARDEVRRM